jgi:hypothetical protein
MIYRGFWIICRTCLFPIRLPYRRKTSLPRKRSNASRMVLLACPVCAHVRPYQAAELKTVRFRIPDPFRRKEAVFYAIDAGCSRPRCDVVATIYAVAATTVSVASLLELWKHWVIHAHCEGHSFKPLPHQTWTVRGVHGIG